MGSTWKHQSDNILKDMIDKQTTPRQTARRTKTGQDEREGINKDGETHQEKTNIFDMRNMLKII